MSSVIPWLAAEAEDWGSTTEDTKGHEGSQQHRSLRAENAETRAGHAHLQIGRLAAHSFPARRTDSPEEAELQKTTRQGEAARENEQGLRVYRRRTVAMLHRYLRYSIETGRLPSLLGKELFRANVTSYSVVTFEDRVIFAHDMETCLGRLDEFSRQLIARHILQEHDQHATARLLHCTDRTVRRLTPIALDRLTDILLEAGLMERLDAIEENPCQEGLEGENFASDCEHGENKF